ncbi:uncharacterized protein LOC106703963 isoform X1 [Latimeria chalumnae]|uniref:uncharacterized protein LOC106703963 isoform X1 n=2 Tax=Latimeria chalumnae TaxID=7897 RepID=UPI00313E0E30
MVSTIMIDKLPKSERSYHCVINSDDAISELLGRSHLLRSRSHGPSMKEVLDKKTNHLVTSPFKQNFFPRENSKCVSPGEHLKSKVLTEVEKMKERFVAKPPCRYPQTPGRLLKGRIKPLHPVVTEGPNIAFCKGILSDRFCMWPAQAQLMRTLLCAHWSHQSLYRFQRPLCYSEEKERNPNGKERARSCPALEEACSEDGPKSEEDSNSPSVFSGVLRANDTQEATMKEPVIKFPLSLNLHKPVRRPVF